jgi:hypothetical protein
MITLEITTHSGLYDIVAVEAYNSIDTAAILNGIKKNESGNTYNVVVFGGNIYSCVDIKGIKKSGGERMKKDELIALLDELTD